MSQEHLNPSQSQEMQFMIQRVYTKNLSFETKHTPAIFQKNWEPELNLDINIHHTAINLEDTAFLVEVEQAGIFTIQGAQGEQLNHILGSFCPSILFPYLRETISSAVSKGSFPPLVLAPINFDALYLQKHQTAELEH
jgi:preprotein translocase subunit SecB